MTLKRYWPYLIVSFYFAGLQAYTLNCLVDTWWINLPLSVMSGILIGLLVAQIAIVNDKCVKLCTTIGNSHYIDSLEKKSNAERELQVIEKLDRLNTELTALKDRVKRLGSLRIVQ